MKAIRAYQIGGPEVLKFEDVPKPRAGPGQVVRIHAAGINPVDTYILSGAYPVKPTVPYTPGIDAAGIVDTAGEGVQGWNSSDRIYIGGSITGTYAEYALCLPSQIHPLPSKVSYPQGAGVNVPYATAYRALFQRAKGLPGETVLVHGASGGVGIASVQFARAAGLTVIGTGGTDEGRKLAADEGAHHVVDHTAPDYLKQIMDLTGGRGVDIILEMASHINLGKDLTVLAKNGRIAVIGNRGPIEINPRDAMSRDANILGVQLANATEKELAGIHAAIVAGLDNGSLRPVVGTELGLAGAARGHREVMESGAYGKIVLLT